MKTKEPKPKVESAAVVLPRPEVFWAELFAKMTPRQRLACTVLVVMEMKRITFAEIARRHGLSRGYLPPCLRGTFPLTINVIRAFEKELDINLYPLVAELPHGGRVVDAEWDNTPTKQGEDRARNRRGKIKS